MATKLLLLSAKYWTKLTIAGSCLRTVVGKMFRQFYLVVQHNEWFILCLTLAYLRLAYRGRPASLPQRRAHQQSLQWAKSLAKRSLHLPMKRNMLWRKCWIGEWWKEGLSSSLSGKDTRSKWCASFCISTILIQIERLCLNMISVIS